MAIQNISKDGFFSIIKFLDSDAIVNFTIANKKIQDCSKKIFNHIWKQIKDEHSEQEKNLSEEGSVSLTWQFFLIREIKEIDQSKCSGLTKILQLIKRSKIQGLISQEPSTILDLSGFKKYVKTMEDVDDNNLKETWPSLRDAMIEGRSRLEEKLPAENEKDLLKIREAISLVSEGEEAFDGLNLSEKGLKRIPFDLYRINTKSLDVFGNEIKYINCSLFKEINIITANNNELEFVDVGNDKIYSTLSFENNCIKQFDCKNSEISFLDLLENPLKKFLPNKCHKIPNCFLPENVRIL